MYCIACGVQLVLGAAFCSSCGTHVGPVPVRQQPQPHAPRVSSETGADLKASLEARRELGPDMEDHVLESFLARLDEQITARVDEQVTKRAPKNSGAGGRGGGLHQLPEPFLVVMGSMGLAIPLMDAANGGLASVPIMFGVVLINMFYFVFRRS